MKPLSTVLQHMPSSATVAVSDKARALKAAGRDIISLAGGDPDFDTPEHILKAGLAALTSGDTHYPASRGTMALREAISRKISETSGQRYNPEREILVSPGGKFALFAALAALVNPGDEVLIMEPYWVSYPSMVTLVGAKPVMVPLDPADGFRITSERILPHVTPKTKALILNSPNNPTGRVLTPDEAQTLRQIALEHDLYVISDEIYRELVFDGRHIPMASLDGMRDRTLTIDGHSKTYAMTGWRLGWVAGPEPIISLAAKFQSHSVTSAASFTMVAGATALTGPQEAVSRMREAYKTRRDFMVSALNRIPGVACHRPEGAFYLFVQFPGLGTDSLKIADLLLEKADIAATPGIAFGASGEGHVRFSIATGREHLEKAIKRIEKLMKSFY